MSSLYIGLMSGTSVDGIDAVLVDFAAQQPRVLAAKHFDIPVELKTQLIAFNSSAHDELAHYAACDVQLGRLFAQSVSSLLASTDYAADDIAAIGSHGQTIRHYPGGQTPTTLQIGDPNIIAEQTGITTVADFRRRDMAAGGQGAPLVPAFHAEIFRHSTETRAVLNLGGIANLTLLPADITQPVTGFDTGPANCLLNDWIHHCQQLDYDHNGQWAAAGCVNDQLLASFLTDDYFSLTPPKSTGRDYFQLSWIQQHVQNFSGLNDADVQATLLALTAQTIAQDVQRYAPQTQRLLVCGGGVHNQTLINRLRNDLPGLVIESTAAHGIDPDYVEATAFAWLAKQTLNKCNGNIHSVTGAQHDCILGGIYLA